MGQSFKVPRGTDSPGPSPLGGTPQPPGGSRAAHRGAGTGLTLPGLTQLTLSYIREDPSENDMRATNHNRGSLAKFKSSPLALGV